MSSFHFQDISFFGSTIQYFPRSTTICFCRDGSLLFIFYSHLCRSVSLMYLSIWILSFTPISAVTLTGYEPGLCTQLPYLITVYHPCCLSLPEAHPTRSASIHQSLCFFLLHSSLPEVPPARTTCLVIQFPSNWTLFFITQAHPSHPSPIHHFPHVRHQLGQDSQA